MNSDVDIEKYRGILVVFAWFLVLILFSLVVLVSQGEFSAVPLLIVLLVLDLTVIIYIVYMARREVREVLGSE